ncbi:hypothetical protein K501DRAFT_14344 [Backusella circina FSU 941]|nr:hypothetical protein K501DRAFT_14344 [Backusella circina FSU 941]
MSLFQTANTSNYLVEFNAGKCIVEGNLIKPDLRKGKIYMDQGADQLLHFYWKERKNQATNEEDLIIFPDEAEFTQVTQCETGRVYLLKFKSSNEHHFFWMQSKDDAKDQEIVERVNGLIRDPESSMDNSAPFDDASQADMMRLLSSVDGQDPSLTQENILEFLQNIGR